MLASNGAGLLVLLLVLLLLWTAPSFIRAQPDPDCPFQGDDFDLTGDGGTAPFEGAAEDVGDRLLVILLGVAGALLVSGLTILRNRRIRKKNLASS